MHSYGATQAAGVDCGNSSSHDAEKDKDVGEAGRVAAAGSASAAVVRASHRPDRSAMSMLALYINRAGSNLGTRQRRVLERAKDELRRSFGRADSTQHRNST